LGLSDSVRRRVDLALPLPGFEFTHGIFLAVLPAQFC